jgi:hypothetical protein
MTTWRYFARKTFPVVVRELGLPAATSNHAPSVSPLHRTTIGAASRTCIDCHHAAWNEVGTRYRTASQGAGGKD